MSADLERLECIGGPLDGATLSSTGYPDREVWRDGSGQYIRVLARNVPVIYRQAPGGSIDPLLRLVVDVWVWSPA